VFEYSIQLLLNKMESSRKRYLDTTNSSNRHKFRYNHSKRQLTYDDGFTDGYKKCKSDHNIIDKPIFPSFDNIGSISFVYDEVINALYGSHLYKCTFCGLRVGEDDVSDHLDKHFHNKHNKKTGPNWFGDLREWVKGSSIISPHIKEDTDHKPVQIKTVLMENKVNDINICVFCHGTIQTKWDHEQGFWVYTGNDIRRLSETTLYHSGCE
jgi:hypothetical protein